MLLSLNRILKLKISNYCILKYKEHIFKLNDSLVKYRIIYMFLQFLAPLYGNENW
jgi:ACT domain-containing protein